MKTATLYQCGTCGRYFGSEAGIRRHQDLYAELHAFDSDIDEHDGQPWTIVEVKAGVTLGSCCFTSFTCKFVSEYDDELWAVGDGRLLPDPDGRRRQAEMSLDVSGGLPHYLSGSHSPSHSASNDRIRAFAAALALGIDDYEVDLREHLHEREMILRADPVRFAGECAYITAAVSVFATQQAWVKR